MSANTFRDDGGLMEPGELMDARLAALERRSGRVSRLATTGFAAFAAVGIKTWWGDEGLIGFVVFLVAFTVVFFWLEWAVDRDEAQK